MTEFSNKFKKPCFWPILGHFPNFGGKKNFPGKSGSVTSTPYGFLAPCQNLEKVNDTIQRKCLDRWKDGQTLFYRAIPATIGGPKRCMENILSFIYTNLR